MDDPPAAAVPKPCCVCDAPGGKHCTRCKSRHYCSKKCQLVDWHERGHKAQCKRLAAEFQERLLDELMPEKKPKEEPPIVEDVLLADGSKAAARLSAVPTAKTEVKATAAQNDAPAWRDTCAICLDVLPVEADQQTLYGCCCKSICSACSDKCRQHDTRCPLCRTPPYKSDAEWLRQMQKHADEGNAEAQVQLAVRYFEGAMGLKKDVTRALKLYELAAAQGNAKAQLILGVNYYRGEGVKIDYKTAALWYRRAAEQGYPQAQYSLGNAFYEGLGVAQSYGEAAQWWGLAAAQGHAQALYYLGICHKTGRGVPRDFDEALRLFKRAAALGHAGAATAAEQAEAFDLLGRPMPGLQPRPAYLVGALAVIVAALWWSMQG